MSACACCLNTTVHKSLGNASNEEETTTTTAKNLGDASTVNGI